MHSRMLSSTLGSAHWMPVAPHFPNYDGQKRCLVLFGGKITPVEKHCAKRGKRRRGPGERMVVWYQDRSLGMFSSSTSGFASKSDVENRRGNRLAHVVWGLSS